MQKISEDTVIYFTEDNLIRIVVNDTQRSSVRYLTIDEFIKCLQSAQNSIIEEDEAGIVYTDTPVLPANSVYTIFVRNVSKGYKYICMVREPNLFNLEYYGTIYKNVGIPKLLFMVRVIDNVLQAVFVCAVKDSVVTEDTLIYKYPFTNVSGIGSICYGGNNISDINIEDYTMLHSVPNSFLTMPNTDHGYGSFPNLSGLGVRPLFENLQDKPFPEEWLSPMIYAEDGDKKIQMTFKNWLTYFK